MTAKTVRVELFRPPGVGTGTFMVLPFDVKAAFGRARAPVKVTLKGVTYRSTVSVYDGKYHLIVNSKVRAQAGVDAGDVVSVRIESDNVPRTVRAPPDLAAALKKDATAAERRRRLSFTHKREWAEAITEAKRPETRERRVAQALRALHGKD